MSGRIAEFVKSNIMLIVMIPSLVGLHWTWLQIQKVDQLVSPEERNLEQPIIRAFKTFKSKLLKRLEDAKPEAKSA